LNIPSLLSCRHRRLLLYPPADGVPPNAYGSNCCDGFQDVFVAGLAAYLEWGLYSTATAIVDNYFTFWVRKNAVIMYRGPEIAQYGRTLTLMAQFYRLTADPTELLLKHAEKLIGFATMLLQRRRVAQRLQTDDPS